MFNKKRIFVFIVFLLLLFFLMTFGGGRGQNAAIATRTVTFTDGYNMKDIAKYEVEVGKDAVVPEVPVHVGYVFTGWYDFENQSVKVTNFKYILEDLHVLAKYSRDANGNGIPDEDDDYFTVTFMDSIDKVAIKSQRVLTGMGATAPNAPVHEGYVFTGWDKPYNKVVSDLIINALYDSNVSEYSSYKVEYYTIHNDETSLYDTKSLNAKTDTTVNAEIITIEGYTYDSSNSLNVISGKVTSDNSLVLKVYYNANEYTVIVDPSCEGDKCNQIEEPHEYGDEFELPKLSNSYTLTYDEADEIGEGLDPETVPATLIGYCKSMETCENPIPAGTKVTVKEDVTYYAVWSEEDVTLKTGSGYETQEKIYSFAKWENGGKQYEAGATFTLTKNETVTAKYTSVPKQYTVIIEPNCAEGEDCTPTDDPENPVPTDPVDYGTTIKLPNIERAYRLTFIENENVKNQLGYEDYVSTLQGYCKNVATCEKTDDTFYNVGDEVTVEEDVTYYAIYDKPVLTAEFGNGANYSTTTENGYFTKWTEEEAETSAEVTSPLTLIADKTIYAQYDKKAKYTITWKNDDGSVLETDTEVEVGTTPTYDGETPTKAADAQYTYTFNAWSPEVATVTGDAEYTATYTNTTNTYTITWKNEDGTVLETDTGVAYGTTPTYDGETPTKAADAQYTYTFNAWSPEVATVTGDAEYTATYTNTTNTYTITWKNEDGTVLETDTGVAYGTTPTYDGETPTKAADAQYTYTFDTWTPEVTAVTGDAEYTATYTNTTNTYTVTWKNEDGSVLETDTGVAYGTTPTYDGETPTKAADAQYTYTFNAWSPEVATVTGDAEYTATYTNTTNTYTITWKNEDGSVLETDTGVAYGTTPTYDGETPTKAADAQYTYAFNAWSPEVTTVTGDAEYTATYNKTAIEYTITYVLNGGTNPDDAKTTYTAEDLPYTLPTPTKEGNSFDGWFDNEELTGDAITTIPANESGNKTFYAKWSVESYKVTYSYTGDVPTGAPTVPAEKTYEYGATVPAAQVPTLGGYVFSGWEDEVTTMPSHDVTVTGSWRERNQDVEIVTTKEVSYDDGDKLSYGDTITFTITVKNNGTDPSDPVTLIDSALAGSPVTLVSTNTTPTSVNTSGDILDGTAGFTVESVPAGGEVVIVITVKVEGEDALPGTPVESQTTYVVNGESKTEEEKWSDLIESEVSFIQKTPNTKGYNIVVLLDQSGSMGYQDKNCLYTDSDGYCRDAWWNLIESTKFINAKAATNAFIDMIFPSATDNTNNSVVSVYRFGSNPKGNQNNFYSSHVGSDATNQSTGTSLKSSISALGDHPYKSGTPYGTAFSSAINKINNLKSNGNDNIVIFLTDGSPSTSNAYEDNLDTLVSMGVKVYSIGFDVNDSQFNLLQSISSQTGVNAYRASNDVDELTQTFAFIKDAFEEPTEEWTEEGTAEMAETLLIDASHPLQIFLNNSTTPYKSCTTDPTTTNNDCTGSIIKKDGKYDVDASKFAAGSKIKVVYYVPAGSKTRRLMKSSVNLNSKDFVDVSTVEDLEAGFHIETEEVPVEEIINVEEETSNNEVESTIVEPETNEEIITDEVINNETIIPETNEVETPVEEPTEVVETPEVSEEPTEEVPETITELPVEVEPIGEVVSVEPIVEETNSTEVVEPEESEEE